MTLPFAAAHAAAFSFSTIKFGWTVFATSPIVYYSHKVL